MATISSKYEYILVVIFLYFPSYSMDEQITFINVIENEPREHLMTRKAETFTSDMLNYSYGSIKNVKIRVFIQRVT